MGAVKDWLRLNVTYSRIKTINTKNVSGKQYYKKGIMVADSKCFRTSYGAYKMTVKIYDNKKR